ncbi:MAG: class GN sortase [Gammaproteobacteria bacterium]|uniref:Sortase family protein n=1 Tax=Marinobacter litoralis TaxID=187981 RepID=A0A3M2RDA3_9GAMM|nr:class GN sortase [Marinobacter litoralis]MBR9872180.1 class GN sortase [Gammaproteobacteria bacterium]RMJ03104.1 Sortase family protein [Marinobacter litoralis]
MTRFLVLLTSASLILLMFGLWIPFKALVAQELLEKAWADSQSQQTEQRPWPWADTWPVAKLELPELGVSMIVLEGGHGESLAFGPGRVFGGERGPLVLAGHRDTHFRHLQNVQPGYRLRVQNQNRQWRQYEVTDVGIVDSRKETIDTHQLAEDSVLLITCYPFDTLDARGPLRYVVKARPVSETGLSTTVAIL